MFRKLVIVAAAMAMPLGLIAAGVLDVGPAGAGTVISLPPATCAMFSAFQMPPPTAIRSVTHVISIVKVLRGAGESARIPPWLPKAADQRLAAPDQP
jgi:hypothetical protein